MMVSISAMSAWMLSGREVTSVPLRRTVSGLSFRQGDPAKSGIKVSNHPVTERKAAVFLRIADLKLDRFLERSMNLIAAGLRRQT
jgi:hypothetical protein